jgi:hypothetical protein
VQALLFNPAKSEQLFQKSHPFLGGVITVQVMAFSKVSSAHKDAVHPLLKCSQDMVRRHARRTHDPNHPHVRGILQPTDPSQVSSSVHSPRADKTNDLRLKFAHFLILLTQVHRPLRSKRKERRAVFFASPPSQQGPSVFLPAVFMAGSLPHAALICDSICWALNPLSCALCDGQVAAQAPQPLHRILFISQTFSS